MEQEEEDIAMDVDVEEDIVEDFEDGSGTFQPLEK